MEEGKGYGKFMFEKNNESHEEESDVYIYGLRKLKIQTII
jgi:hypothetical protein